MLRSRSVHGDDLYSYSCDEESARHLSKLNELLCPSCNKPVHYKKGEKVSAHFAHKRMECVVNTHEPETEAHIKGKQLLFGWLKREFPDANIELEVYIPATQQIADILVEHLLDDLAGQKWAFEFQHSPLSEASWSERHQLYQQAGIHDFWIMDADIYLKYSKSVEHARLFREPLESAYNHAGLCYYLDINTSMLTIDCNFMNSTYRYPGKPKSKPWSYKYHSPISHSTPLGSTEFIWLNDYHYAALSFPMIDDKVNERVDRQYQKFWYEEQLKQKQLIDDRLALIEKYSIEKRDERFSRLLMGVLAKNRSTVVEDILSNDPAVIVDKYEPFVEKVDAFLKEHHSIREQSDLQSKVITELSPVYSQYPNLDPNYIDAQGMELYDIDFLNNIPDSFTDFLIDRYRDKLMIAWTVIGNYDNELSKLAGYNPKSISKRLADVRYFLKPRGEVTKEEIASKFIRCDSVEEADELMHRIKIEVIEEIENPSWLRELERDD